MTRETDHQFHQVDDTVYDEKVTSTDGDFLARKDTFMIPEKKAISSQLFTYTWSDPLMLNHNIRNLSVCILIN